MFVVFVWCYCCGFLFFLVKNLCCWVFWSVGDGLFVCVGIVLYKVKYVYLRNMDNVFISCDFYCMRNIVRDKNVIFKMVFILGYLVFNYNVCEWVSWLYREFWVFRWDVRRVGWGLCVSFLFLGWWVWFWVGFVSRVLGKEFVCRFCFFYSSVNGVLILRCFCVFRVDN